MQGISIASLSSRMRPTYVRLDMTSCALPTQAALSVFGRQHIDVLVSNAAVNPAGGPILQMEDHVIDKILQVVGAWPLVLLHL